MFYLMFISLCLEKKNSHYKWALQLLENFYSQLSPPVTGPGLWVPSEDPAPLKGSRTFPRVTLDLWEHMDLQPGFQSPGLRYQVLHNHPI